MKRTFNIVRILSRHTWWWTFALIVLLAFALSAARLLLPQLDRYKGYLELEVSEVIGQPVSVAEIEVGWHGYGPRLFLHDVRLHDRSGDQVLFGFDLAHIDVSLPLTLYRWQLALRDLTLKGIELSLQRQTDGSVSVAGLELPQAAADQAGQNNDDAVLAWLFSQEYLAIEESVIHWHDLMQGDYAFTMRDVSLKLYNEDEQHSLSGHLRLPSSLGGRVKVMAETQGSIENLADSPVDFYVEGRGLELVQWLADRPTLGLRILNGSAEIELWGRWQQNKLDNIKGHLFVRDVYLASDVVALDPEPEQQLQMLASVFAEFVWQNDVTGWQLDVDRLRPVKDNVAWQPARVRVRHHTSEAGDELEVVSSFARLDDVASLLLLSSHLPDAQKEMLQTMRPGGELHGAYLKLGFAENKLQDYFVRAELKNLALMPWQKLPGFDGLDLSLNMDPSGGVVDVATKGAYLDLRSLFRDFLTVDSLSGRLAWQQDGSGMLLDMRDLELSNQDAAVALAGQLFFPVDKTSPIIKLLLDIKRGNAEMTSRYLPDKIMPKAALAWLDSAIVAGNVNGGSMVLQGPVKQFPFNDASGRFEVRFSIDDGIIDYAQGWPRIEQIATEVAFVGDRMDINAEAGKVLAADIGQVAVEIPDMRAHPAVLRLHGRVQGSAGDVLGFINQSPLQQRFGNFSEGAVAEGDSSLDLSLNIPLASGADVETVGRVRFEDSAIDLTRLGVDLTSLSGEIEFSSKGLSAQGISAVVMGQPANVDIYTQELPRDKSNTVFVAQGESRLAELEKRFDLFVFPYLGGEAGWQARLEIPRSKNGGAASPTLKLESNLQGIGVHLPEPLQKAADSSRPFDLFARFDEQASHWFFDYGEETLTGVFELAGAKGLQSGELRFAGAAELPQKKGLRLAGKLERFVYDEWQPLFVVDQESPKKDAVVNRLDLQFDSVELFAQTLHKVQLQADHIEQIWDADIKSDEMAGRIWLPDSWNNVLKMDLEHLYISRKTAESETTEEPFDPRELPPLIINSKQTHFGDLNLGQVSLTTRKLPLGMLIDSLETKSDIVETSIKGQWLVTKQHSSLVNAELKLHDLGAVLAGLGYVETVKNAEGVGKLSLKWDGPLLDYDLASLDGTVDFDFEDGRLLEVEPGAGRFFGLLSITALPRRLMLDFSDFFGKGFAFDTMRGHFDINDGDANTKDFFMDGPAARIDLQGRVGLAKEDYDQRVKVVPHVTSGLPTLAAVLTGQIGPAVVWALIEKLTKSGVDKVTGVYYQVTGSWDDPLIEPVDLVQHDK